MLRLRLKELIDQKSKEERRKITHEEIADNVHLDRSTLTKIIQGNYEPKLSTVGALCEYFRCGVKDILEYVPDEEFIGELRCQTYDDLINRLYSDSAKEVFWKLLENNKNQKISREWTNIVPNGTLDDFPDCFLNNENQLDLPAIIVGESDGRVESYVNPYELVSAFHRTSTLDSTAAVNLYGVMIKYAQQLEYPIQVGPQIAYIDEHKEIEDVLGSRNLLVVGAPKVNAVGHIVNAISPFYFPERAHQAFAELYLEDKILTRRIDAIGPSLGIGIAILLRSPFNPERNLLWCAGSHRHGTYGACQALEFVRGKLAYEAIGIVTNKSDNINIYSKDNISIIALITRSGEFVPLEGWKKIGAVELTQRTIEWES